MGGKIKTFKDLYAWQEGHKLVIMIYETTKHFPKEEVFGLTIQMKRCVISVTSNIAEGFSRESYKDKAHFYVMAQSSVTELQNQIIISKDIKLISEKEYQEVLGQTTKVHKIINGLIRKSKSIHNS